MNRVVSHINRLLRKYWIFLLFVSSISIVIGLGVFLVATIVSLAFFNDPVEAKNPTDYFTEDELRKIQSEEDLDDEEYLTLLAKYQTYECPVKVDEITTWTSSEVTKESFICNYEILDRWNKYGEIDMDVLKKNILEEIDKDSYKVQRIVATNRNMIFRYRNYRIGTIEDIVLSNEELRG